jgi:uncharacterized protein (DUF1684 family)
LDELCVIQIPVEAELPASSPYLSNKVKGLVNLTRKFALCMTVVASTCALSTVAHAAVDNYQLEIQQWQHDRLEKLKSPESWLSVTASEEVRKGTSSIGSGADQDIVLPSGPSHLGNLTYAGNGALSLALDNGSQATIDHSPTGPGSIEPFHVDGLYFFPDGTLVLDPAKKASNNPPSVIHVNTETLKIYSYEGESKGKKRLIVTDSQAPRLTQFKGLDYFPIDASWKITADWETLKEPREVEVAYIRGTVEKIKLKNKVVFFKDGKRYELMPYMQDDEKGVLFVFADGTSGKETYGGARFLITPSPKNGKIVLDFNKAVNPPCAFIPFPNCPIAIPENRLSLRIEAGEKKVHEDI